MAKSPLMYGGDMRHMDKFTYDLLTNREMLAINAFSRANQQIRNETNGTVRVWRAVLDHPWRAVLDHPSPPHSPTGPEAIVLAIFNLGDSAPNQTITVSAQDFFNDPSEGGATFDPSKGTNFDPSSSRACTSILDVWAQAPLPVHQLPLSVSVPSHGVRVLSCQTQ